MELNPYEAPQQVEPTEAWSWPTSLLSRNQWLAWLFVFVLNLIVPVLFGLVLCRTANTRIGMFLGIAMLFGVSCVAIYFSPHWAKSWTYGALIVAVTQLMPFLQLMFGIVASLLVESFVEKKPPVNHEDIEVLDTLIGSLCATLITGIMLGALALMLGFALFGNQRRNAPGQT